jgi:hypothetical protein
MIITLRLSPSEQEALDRLAAARSLDRSAAIRKLIQDEDIRTGGRKALSFHERMKEDCGMIDSGRTDASMRSREEFERYIEEKHRERRRPR